MKFSLRRTPSPPADSAVPPAPVAEAKIRKPRHARAERGGMLGRLLTRSGRFVLLIGDEGAVLTHLKGKQVTARYFAPSAKPEHLQEFRKVLEADTSASLILVTDMIDQTYVQQTLPPVSRLSVNKLIKRRLDRDFDRNDLKGALIVGREEGGRKDWNFLMASVDKTPAMTAWIDFVVTLPQRFGGLYLAPVESELLVRLLEKSATPKGVTGSKWQFLVSHNKVGGFRQVIFRDRRIAFTRLGQPIGEATPEVIAGSIEQEILSTLEYMKRLSFNPQAGLNLYIVASGDICKSIDKNRFQVASAIHLLTPYEACGKAGMEGVALPSDQYGDVMLAAAIGISRTRILKLATPFSHALDRLHNVIFLQRIVAGALGASLLGYIIMGALGYYQASVRIDDIAARTATARGELDQITQTIGKSVENIDRMNHIIDMYRSLFAEAVSPAFTFEQLKSCLIEHVTLKGVEWSVTDPLTIAAPPAAGVPPPPPMAVPPPMAAVPHRIAMTLNLELPISETNPDFTRQVTQAFTDTLKKRFVGYEVAMPELAKTDESKPFEINFSTSQTAPQNATESARKAAARIILKGPLIHAPKPEQK